MSTMVLYFLCGVSLIGTLMIPRGYFASDWPIVALNILGRACANGTLAICYVYSAEIYPTVVRNAGIGSSSLWARLAPMLAPYIKDLNFYEERLPIVVFGVFAMIASFLVTFLPETAHHKLPDTIEEGENLGKGENFYSSMCGNSNKKSIRENDSTSNGAIKA